MFSTLQSIAMGAVAAFTIVGSGAIGAWSAAAVLMAYKGLGVSNKDAEQMYRESLSRYRVRIDVSGQFPRWFSILIPPNMRC